MTRQWTKRKRQEMGSNIEKMSTSPPSDDKQKHPARDLTMTEEEEGQNNNENKEDTKTKNNEENAIRDEGKGKDSSENNESDDVVTSSSREAKRRRTSDDNDNNDAAIAAVAVTTADSKLDATGQDDADADAAGANEHIKKGYTEEHDKNSVAVDEKTNTSPSTSPSSDNNQLLHYEVLGDGETRSDGRTYYNTIRVKWGNDDDNNTSASTILRKGTVVYLNKLPTDHSPYDWICCIHEFYRVNNTDNNSNKDEKESKNSNAVDNNKSQSNYDKDESNSNSSKSEIPLRMRGYWLLRPNEVEGLGNDKQFEGGKKLVALLKEMKANEVLLTNIDTDHDVGSIQRVCHIGSSSNDTDDTVHKTVDNHDDDHRSTTTSTNKNDDNKQPNVICRYKLFVDTNKYSVNFIPYQVGDEDDIDHIVQYDDMVMEETEGNAAAMTTDHDVEVEVEEDDDEVEDQQSDENDDDLMEDQSRNVIQEGEGSTLRGDILVGPKYQMDVKPFNPNNARRVKSRNPKLVWTSENTLTDDKVHEFLSDLALIHTKYLRENNLIILNEPYSPLRSELAEKIMRENLAKNKNNRDEPFYLTGSSMSSSSRLVGTTTHRNTLLRECDVDKVLELLHEHQYDTAAALDTARRNLYSISTIWGKNERDEYDAAFRLHPSSALREISQFFKPESNKSLPDIIDYHYRFKLPDQFRKLQDRKMEQSIKMIEVIENRKSISDILGNVAPSSSSANAGIASTTQSNASSINAGLIGTTSTDDNGNNNNNTNSTNKDAAVSLGTTVAATATQATAQRQHLQWFEKPIAIVAVERDERIRKAKKLLLDVREILGPDVVKDVAGVIRKLQVSYDPVLRDSLFVLLRNQPELQNRFSEFLPRLY